MSLTSIVGVIEIAAGIILFLIPAIGVTQSISCALIFMGLSTLGVSQKINNQVQGVKGIW